MVICDSPASSWVKLHKLSEDDIVMVYIIPDICASCCIDDRYVLQDFSGLVWVGAIIKLWHRF